MWFNAKKSWNQQLAELPWWAPHLRFPFYERLDLEDRASDAFEVWTSRDEVLSLSAFVVGTIADVSRGRRDDNAASIFSVCVKCLEDPEKNQPLRYLGHTAFSA